MAKKKHDDLEILTALAETAGAPRSPARPKARRRAAASAGQARNIAVTPDAGMAAMFKTVTATSGGRIILDSIEAEKLVCGLPWPALSLSILFGQDVMPLARSFMIFGDPGSCKSAFLDEWMRIVLLHKGLVVYDENENKDAADLRNAVMWHDEALLRRIKLEQSNSQEEWMEIVTQWTGAFDEQYARKVPARRGVKKKPDESITDYKKRIGAKIRKERPGYIHPFLIGVDAITSTSSDATIQKIREEGSPTRRYQIEAAYLSDYAKAIPTMTRGRPMVLVMVNHRKELIDERTSLVSDKIPGGSAMRFMATNLIKMQVIPPAIKTADYGGKRIRISLPKNSLAPGDGVITVLFKWWWQRDEKTGKLLQHAAWDWDAATIAALLAQKQFSAKRWAEISEIVDLHAPNKTTVWSKVLGIPEDRPVPFTDAGRMLEARRDLVTALYEPLHIKTRTRFIPGVPYEDTEALLEANREAQESVYGGRDLSGTAFMDEEIEDAAAAKKQAKKRGKSKEEPATDGDGDGES
jgi:hypothetical protein